MIREELLINVPTSIEEEQRIIGTLIHNHKRLREIPWLKPFHFYDMRNRELFKIIEGIKEHIDLVIIENKVKNVFTSQQREEINLTALYLADIWSGVDGDSPLQSYAEIVKDSYGKRLYQKRLKNAAENLGTPSCDCDKISLDTINNTNKFIMMRPKTPFSLFKSIDEAKEELSKVMSVIPINLFGISLDKGNLNFIGGRPGHLKTSTALQIAKNLLQSGYGVDIFSLEMRKTDLLGRIASNISGVTFTDVRELVATEQELKEFNNAFDYVKDNFTKFRIYDDYMSPEQMIRIVKQNSPDVFIIDYIQLMVENQDKIRQEINSILRSLHSFIKHTSMCCIIVSQLSRNIENRIDQRPRMSDFAESGHIEQFASCILALYYDYTVRNVNSKDGKNVVRIYELKGRHKDKVQVPLYCDAGKCQIRTMTKQEYTSLNERYKPIIQE